MRLTTNKAEAVRRHKTRQMMDGFYKAGISVVSAYRQATDTAGTITVTMRTDYAEVSGFDPAYLPLPDDADLWRYVDRWYSDADYRMAKERASMERSNADDIANGDEPFYSEADILAACEALCDIVLIGYVAVEEETAP